MRCHLILAPLLHATAALQVPLRVSPPLAVVRSRNPVAVAFNSAEEYEAWLGEASALPQGFRVGVTGFEFTPEEADLPSKMNITLVALDEPTANFAAVFTLNSFCGSPIVVGRQRLASSPTLQAVVVNNKISNVCAAGDGVAASEAICKEVANQLNLPGGSASVLPSSTGVIGWKLPVAAMTSALPQAVAALQSASALPAARSIMTTDRYPKLRSVSACGGRIVAFAKGAGMIEPNMATMLAYVLTDVDIPRAAMQEMLSRSADVSFNCVSVDADQSTSDTLVMLSSCKVKVSEAQEEEFEAALATLLTSLSSDLVRNGEGTKHVMKVAVSGAPSRSLARGVGKAVVNSPLFKSAVAGNDPNVGRLVAAVGSYLGKVEPGLDLSGMRVSMGGHEIFRNGKFAINPELEEVRQPPQRFFWCALPCRTCTMVVMCSSHTSCTRRGLAAGKKRG